MRLCVGLYQRDLDLLTPGEAKIPERFIIDWENTAGGAVFRCHVGDGGSLRERQCGQSVAKEFDKLADHAVPTQHLHHAQHQVGRGDAFAQASIETKADDFRYQHGYRLPKHRRLRFDTTHTPAEHTKAIDHGGMTVRPYKRVGIGELLIPVLVRPHHPRQVLEIDLMADARPGRHHAKILKRLLAPAQELVSFSVARHLDLDVFLKGFGARGFIHHD